VVEGKATVAPISSCMALTGAVRRWPFVWHRRYADR
jgi:hypothetical protein